MAKTIKETAHDLRPTLLVFAAFLCFFVAVMLLSEPDGGTDTETKQQTETYEEVSTIFNEEVVTHQVIYLGQKWLYCQSLKGSINERVVDQATIGLSCDYTRFYLEHPGALPGGPAAQRGN